MNIKNVTNSTVFEDWSGNERRAALSRIRPQRVRATGGSISGVPVTQVWMTDVSGGDRRSVKAMLAGKGDLRVMLWRIKSLLGLVRIVAAVAVESAPTAAHAPQSSARAHWKISLSDTFQLHVHRWPCERYASSKSSKNCGEFC
jgi:hypothetical protein